MSTVLESCVLDSNGLFNVFLLSNIAAICGDCGGVDGEYIDFLGEKLQILVQVQVQTVLNKQYVSLACVHNRHGRFQSLLIDAEENDKIKLPLMELFPWNRTQNIGETFLS